VAFSSPMDGARSFAIDGNPRQCGFEGLSPELAIHHCNTNSEPFTRAPYPPSSASYKSDLYYVQGKSPDEFVASSY
jgi:hypothetical protein